MPLRALAVGASLAAVLYGSGCQAPFTTNDGPAADTTAPADTAPDIPHGPRDTLDTAAGPVRLPPDSVALPPGLDTGFARGGGVRAVPVFDPAQVPLSRPVWFGAVPGHPEAYLALEQYSGSVAVIRKTATGWGRSDFLKLDVRPDGEMGLLAFAFHPSFAEDGRYYVGYVPKGGALVTVIEERRADASRLKDAGGPARPILRLAQPYQNHKSLTMAFGPKDGFLYVATGDGGATVAGQDGARLLGKILRLDVNAPDSFRVPADNPFVGKAGMRPEIWALGLRNPWKWSFDALTGDIWVGDVGEEAREEIDLVGPGDNLGWGVMEGTTCHQAGACGQTGLKSPLIDFGRNQLTVLIGGYVYRGDPASPWYGAYFFADYASHALWVLRRGPDGKPSEAKKLLDLPATPSSFGTDAAGNLYVVGYGNGVLYRLEADSGTTPGQGRL